MVVAVHGWVNDFEQRTLPVCTYRDQRRSRSYIAVLRRYGVPTILLEPGESPSELCVLYVDYPGTGNLSGRYLKMIVPGRFAHDSIPVLGAACAVASIKRSIAILNSYIDIVDWLNEDRKLPFHERKGRSRVSHDDYQSAIERYRKFQLLARAAYWDVPPGVRITASRLENLRQQQKGLRPTAPLGAIIRLS